MGEAERVNWSELTSGLEPTDLSAVLDFIGYLRTKRERQALPPLLAEAPLDDEPTTAANLAAIEAAFAEPGTISLEQMKAEFEL